MNEAKYFTNIHVFYVVVF